MKIKDYIVTILSNIEGSINEVGFEFGSDDGMNISDESKNRIKFTVVRK